MIAPLVLLNFCLAHGTEGDIVFVCLGPLAQLLVHRLLAGDFVAMPHITALEADLGAALVASQLRRVAIIVP